MIPELFNAIKFNFPVSHETETMDNILTNIKMEKTV